METPFDPQSAVDITEAAAPREDFDARVSGIAALGEPVRRALYRYVVGQGSPVNRDQAAEGVGVAHHIAKFHLDKLVDDDLLETEFGRPPGRGAPAPAGRRSSTAGHAGSWKSASLSGATGLAGSLLAGP